MKFRSVNPTAFEIPSEDKTGVHLLVIAEVQFTKTMIGAESPAPVDFNAPGPATADLRKGLIPGEVDLEIITVRVEPLDSSLPDTAR